MVLVMLAFYSSVDVIKNEAAGEVPCVFRRRIHRRHLSLVQDFVVGSCGRHDVDLGRGQNSHLGVLSRGYVTA